MQAEQLTANLARAGIRTDEYVFSAAGANRLARSLWGALRDHALDLPDDEETRSEFLTTRLVETGPGVVKLQNPPGAHDDIVTAVGMLVVDLTEQPDPGRASITVPTGRIGRRDTRNARDAILAPTLGGEVSIMHARNRARSGPRGLPGAGAILGVPGAYDDPRRRRSGNSWHKR